MELSGTLSFSIKLCSALVSASAGSAGDRGFYFESFGVLGVLGVFGVGDPDEIAALTKALLSH